MPWRWVQKPPRGTTTPYFSSTCSSSSVDMLHFLIDPPPDPQHILPAPPKQKYCVNALQAIPLKQKYCVNTHLPISTVVFASTSAFDLKASPDKTLHPLAILVRQHTAPSESPRGQQPETDLAQHLPTSQPSSSIHQPLKRVFLYHNTRSILLQQGPRRLLGISKGRRLEIFRDYGSLFPDCTC